MKKEFKIRYTITGIVFVIIMALLVVRLFDLQFVKGETYLSKVQIFSQKTIRLTGPRGKILDTNGLPLAYNTTTYSVQFVRDSALSILGSGDTSKKNRSNYTQCFIQTMRIVEANGGKFLSTFSISRMKDGSYDFYWPGVDKTKDKQTYDARVTNWMKLNAVSPIKSTTPPAEIFTILRQYYGIPEDMSYEDAYKILSAWEEVRSTYYASYMPITLAEAVNMNTVSSIEIHSNELLGMQISQSNMRVYPNKTMAAHIIGYMGRMLDEKNINDMLKLGYSREDLIGISGIEDTMEPELSGNTTERSGSQVVEVDSRGKVIRQLSSSTPKAGNNVILTIDSGLQKRLEESLAQNIEQIKSEQKAAYNKDPAKYDAELNKRKDKEINWASVGAAVVMDTQTGNVLAMASYPTYDPNVFTGGLSQKDKDLLFSETSNNPLFNNAISSRGTPGSVFKMCTGLAGLAENVITTDTRISDDGPYTKYVKDGGKAPSCWLHNNLSLHANQTIVEGLEHSCNYFFFKVADDLGINRLTTWADKLGLTSKTNIELPSEAKGQVGNQQSLYSKDNMSGVAALVRNHVVDMLKQECVSLHMNYDDGIYTQAALEMMDLVNSGLKEYGTDIRAILKNELKLSSTDIAKSNLVNEISAMLTEIKWNGNFTIEAGIGQSVTLLTPIAMARYVSAIVNGGNVYEARLVKSIMTPDGTIRTNPPKLIRNLGVPTKYLDKIMEGMAKVVSDEEGGTAASFFTNFKYTDQMGGKTGTAQVSQTIDLENNSWFVAFAPYKKDDPTVKPEIVVVVYIPHGYKGALSGYTVQQAIQYYLDKKYQQYTPGTIPQAGELVK